MSDKPRNLSLSAAHALPPVTPGFEHINRYWDKRLDVPAVKLMPGELYVSTQGEMIVTVLGSCVSACVRDRRCGIGGMNHFMLPVQGEHSSVQWGNDPASAASRYGNWAMEYLINEILKRGGRRENLEVKIFGGGKVLKSMTDIGDRNIRFVKDYLAREGLTIAAQDVGDLFPRKILYFPDTGSVKVRKLKSVENTTIEMREVRYIQDINRQPRSGDVELFD